MPLRAILILGLAALGAAAGGTAGSADPAAPAAPAPATAAAAGAPTGRPLALDKGKSELIHLSRPARDILVGQPAIADVALRTPDTAFILARDFGETNVYFFDAEGHEIDEIDVTVGSRQDDVANALKRVLPRDDITVSSAGTSVVLTGSVESQQDADNARLIAAQFVTPTNVINLLSVREKSQVLLRVRVTEMQRNTIKELGITPGFPAPLQFTVGGLTFDFGGNSSVSSVANPYGSVFLNTSPTTPPGTVAIPPTGAAASTSFSALLEALEQNGMVKTLAEPNLTALSGETATFRAGGQFYIPQQVAIGTTTGITAQPYGFGIQLTFTPVVLSGGLISLRIATSVTEPVGTTTTINGTAIPNLTDRSAATTVELPSGGSIAIAGLLENDASNTIAGLPGIMDVPILGALFSSKDFQHNETDLVIAVTAYVVRPTDPNRIAFPSDGFGPASDFNMYFLGKLNATYTKPTPDQPPKPTGPFGFILE